MRTESIRTVLGETCLDVTVQEGFAGKVAGLAADARAMVEAAIGDDPFFGTTYGPYPARPDHPPMIRRMCDASVRASVGPMAAVAGAVASHVAEGLMEAGCRHAVIDNGGDIAMFSDSPVAVRILPDPGGEPVAFMVETDGILGICSSSGLNGHSVSLGESDVCTVVSRDPVLADACATLLGNLVGPGTDLSDAAEKVCSVPGVSGCLASIGGMTAVCGELPPFVPLNLNRI